MLSEEQFAILSLIRSENIGFKTYAWLLKTFGSAQQALLKVQKLNLKNIKAQNITLANKEEILKEVEQTHKYGARFIFADDLEYPQILKTIYDHPPVLTVYGSNVSLLNQDIVAGVGSRNCSINGRMFASKIAQDLGEHGYVTVSGMARGIDSSLHLGSLKTGTIAVIAGGISHIYPPENADLYKQIAENGLIVAENSFGVGVQAKHFAQRNRIIAGLARAVIVIEGSIKSGSLITANFALEYSRELFAVPGFPLDLRYSGNNYLLKNGAHLYETIEDLSNVLKASSIKPYRTQMDFFNTTNEVINTSYKPTSNKKDIEKIRDTLVSCLTTTPVSLDYLSRTIDVPIKFLLVAVMELELSGVIIKSGNSVCLLK